MAKKLPQLSTKQERFGMPTIMRRELASKYDARYVRLAALAIDLERVAELFDHHEETTQQSVAPFGWEVALQLAFLSECVSKSDPLDLEMLDDVMASIFEAEEPDEYGAGLNFAIWMWAKTHDVSVIKDALKRVWRKPPTELFEEVKALDETTLKNVASKVLQAELSPPLTPPTKEWLEALHTKTLESKVETKL